MSDNFSSEVGNDVSGSNIVGSKDAQLNHVVFNNESAFNYTLADLRLDIRFQKQEIDRLRDELNRDRQTDAATESRLAGRLDSMQSNLDFLDEQVKGMLLLKPAPATTPAVSVNVFYAFLTVVGVFVVLVTIMLMLLARGN